LTLPLHNPSRKRLTYTGRWHNLLFLVEKEIWFLDLRLPVGDPGRELELVELGKLDSLLRCVETQHGVEIRGCDSSRGIAVAGVAANQVPKDTLAYRGEVDFGNAGHGVRHAGVLDNGEVVCEGSIRKSCPFPGLDRTLGFSDILHRVDKRQRGLHLLRLKPVLLAPGRYPFCYGGVTSIQEQVVRPELGLVFAWDLHVPANIIGLHQR